MRYALNRSGLAAFVKLLAGALDIPPRDILTVSGQTMLR